MSTAESKRKWRVANPEKQSEYDRKWRATADPERLREYSRKWRAANPKKLRASNRTYRATNLEKARANSREWVAANPEKVRAANRKRYGLPLATRPMPELCERNCGRRALCLDHCHTTNTFRGWLCHRCNTGIGMLGDTVEDLLAGIDYLQRVK